MSINLNTVATLLATAVGVTVAVVVYNIARKETVSTGQSPEAEPVVDDEPVTPA